GLLGISYYAMNQWQVAARQPAHLVAICPWEGVSDCYREFARHGGILDIFTARWYPIQVSSVQHGVGERSARSLVTGEPVAGPDTSPGAELATLRADAVAELLAHRLDDNYYRARTPDLEKITVPVLSAANWAHHLHTRGNFEGYLRGSSTHKWLEVHGEEHFTEFYTDYGVALQKRFFGHFLHGEDTGWDTQPPVQLNVRNVDGTYQPRAEQEWPLARTQWTTLFLDTTNRSLHQAPPGHTGQASYEACGNGLTFLTEPLPETVEITGPAAAKLFICST